MQNNKEMMCDSCRKLVPTTDVRYASNSRSLNSMGVKAVCSSCRAKAEAGAKSATMQVSKKPGYFCSRCNYNFKSLGDDKKRINCPYCGKDDRISTTSGISADKMIKIAHKDDYE
jgi:DNA-directed RNA polymerase subunit RPC12/RpoP